MKKVVFKILDIFFSVMGSVVGLYVGGYLMFVRSVAYLYTGFTGGGITRRGFVISIICIFMATTVIGFFWCLFDIIAGVFRDKPRFKDL